MSQRHNNAILENVNAVPTYYILLFSASGQHNSTAFKLPLLLYGNQYRQCTSCTVSEINKSLLLRVKFHIITEYIIYE